MGIIPETEVVDSCKVIFPNKSARMKRWKTSIGKDKEVKTILSDLETVTNWSWGQQKNGLTLTSF